MKNYSPGRLVNYRNRDWVVLPSKDEEMLLLKPLGGSEEEITGVFKLLNGKSDEIKDTEFEPPTAEDIGNLSSARLLYDACRLSFRNGSGPFRSLAKLSFRPRSYQIVPLIMALKQNPVRLFIADDVGVGKTIEALMIVKELLERKEINRFAVICLPHLCEQWQAELKDKFGIDAVIIRSNTQARLDREVPSNINSVYKYYPYQVISIDYIKSETRRNTFLHDCPEFVIVDEAHTCSNNSQQHQRYALIKDISEKVDRHLVLLTATPHSGKSVEFNSLLGLLKPEFELLDLPSASTEEKKELAKHFIQRKRIDVEKWLGEETPFPERDSGEFDYTLSTNYNKLFQDILRFAKGITPTAEPLLGKNKMKYWTALGLLRGVMSSPAAGVEMLHNRMEGLEEDDDFILQQENPVLDNSYGVEGDFTPTQVVKKSGLRSEQYKQLNEFGDRLESFASLQEDHKAENAKQILTDWILAGHNPVVFCRYIATAKYLGALLTQELRRVKKDLDVQVITSEDPDELRKQRIEEMSSHKNAVLICTDCLSEGINLQDHFSAVLHYDLPWNPNRLEQREGRVDRYGQKKEKVFAYLLYGSNNPIDGVVFDVLLKKVREIKRSNIGISVPISDESKSILDTILTAVLINPGKYQPSAQLSLGFNDPTLEENKLSFGKSYDEAVRQNESIRNIFAQNAIKADEIEIDLKQTDESIGDPAAVENFLLNAMALLGVQLLKDKKGYSLYTINLPDILKTTLPAKAEIKISFLSPTPEDYLYIGRNHLFVEQLCQFLLAKSLNHETRNAPARASVIKTSSIKQRTTILLFRARNVIKERDGKNQLVAEEMLLWGYAGDPEHKQFLSSNDAMTLLTTAKPSAALSKESQEHWLTEVGRELGQLKEAEEQLAESRAEVLAEAHERFRKAMGGRKYQPVKPVLPMDKMGIYILLPD